MATNYPGSLDSYSTKAAGNTVAEGHINDPQDAIEAIQEKVGVGASGTIAQSASTNTALLGYGASLTGYSTVALGNRSLVTGTLPASAVAIGGQVKMVKTLVTAYDAGTASNIPRDNTKPQISEAGYVAAFDTAITPDSITNRLLIQIEINVEGGAAQHMALCLFQDAGTDALACSVHHITGLNIPQRVSLTYEMPAGTIASTTFKVGVGVVGGAGTISINEEGGTNPIFNGTLTSSVVITEIKV